MTMDLDLAGKVAIVTGSSRGLGLAGAAALVREGGRGTICARGEGRLAPPGGGAGRRRPPVSGGGPTPGGGGESRRDQPGEVDGAAAGTRQYSGQQRRAGVDPVSWGIVAPSSAGRSGRNCRFCAAGAAIRALRPPRRGRGGGRISRLAARELD